MKRTILMFLVIYLIFTAIFLKVNPSYAAVQKIEVTSTNFENKGFITDLNACEFIGLNKSPQFSFNNAPSNTQSFALIMFDLDAPEKNFVHWIIFNIPADLAEIQQDISNDISIQNGIKQGTNGTGEIDYFGPCPPPGETHRYVFKAFALDAALTLEDGATEKQLVRAMKGHIVGKGKIVGLYKNNTNN